MDTMRQTLAASMAVLATLLLPACGGDELTGNDDEGNGHATVAGARIYDAASADLTSQVVLPAGQAVRLRVQFVDESGTIIAGLESGHDAALRFDPAGLATATPVPDQKFFFDVVAHAAAGATGQVSVGYGHGGSTDEETFGPFPVSVQ